jgi:cell division protein ZapA
MNKTAFTKVTIHGEEYRVAGKTSGSPIAELAAFVDDKIDEVRQRSNIVDMKRIAVLAALNLADELLAERARSRALIGRVAEQAERLTSALEETPDERESGVGSLDL